MASLKVRYGLPTAAFGALGLAEDDLELLALGTAGPWAFPRGTNLCRLAPDRRHPHSCRDASVVRKVREVFVRENRLLLCLTRVRELLRGQLSVCAGCKDLHAIVDRPLRQMTWAGLPSDLGPGPRAWMVILVTARQDELRHIVGAVSEAGPLEDFSGLPPPRQQVDAQELGCDAFGLQGIDPQVFLVPEQLQSLSYGQRGCVKEELCQTLQLGRAWIQQPQRIDALVGRRVN